MVKDVITRNHFDFNKFENVYFSYPKKSILNLSRP